MVGHFELESLSWSSLRFSSDTCLERSGMLRVFVFLRGFKPNTAGKPALLLETVCRLITSVKLHSYYGTSHTTPRNGSSNRCLLWSCALDWRISYRAVLGSLSSIADRVVTPSDVHSRAFVKLRKATISFIMSVCLSVRTELLGSHLMDFHEIWSFEDFSKVGRENSSFTIIWQK
jgi:hypothetical protein